MHASERANLPSWKGDPGHFEIWFLVVFDAADRAATWLRYTTFSPTSGTPQAMLWAADFDSQRAPTTIWGKQIFDATAYRAASDHFEITIGDARLRHGHSTGVVASGDHAIHWDLHFQPSEAPVRRTPALLEQVGLATQAVHACTDAPCTGFVEVDGVRRNLTTAVVAQIHLYGTRRLDELGWIWAPRLTGLSNATLEVTSVRTHYRSLRALRAPRVTSIFYRHDDELDDLTQMPDAMRPTVETPAPGVLAVAHTSALRAVRIRSFAPLASFAGWAYRNPTGEDLYVAQSDIASTYVETFTRRHPFAVWQPRTAGWAYAHSALELHGAHALPHVAYVPWEATEPPAMPPLEPREVPPPPHGDYALLPPATSVIAAGTTYRAADTPVDHDFYVYDKGIASTLVTQFELTSRATVALPTFAALSATLQQCNPELAQLVRERYRTLPVLLDFEVELIMIVLEDCTAAELRTGRMPRIGWAVGVDLASRTVQILGTDTAEPMRFWAAAKGLPGFLPMAHRMWIPAEPKDEVPDVQLRCWVNGDIRQDARANHMAYRPSQVLAKAAALLGRPLQAGDRVLCGTPEGLPLKAPAWQRRLAALGGDRFAKLDAAIKMYVDGAGFLRPGDVVEFDAGFVGNASARIDVPNDGCERHAS